MTRGPGKDPQYPDTGCPGGCDASLTCPLPRCVYDAPMPSVRHRRAMRDARIVMRRSEGVTVAKIAAGLRVCARTVHRVLERKNR